MRIIPLVFGLNILRQTKAWEYDWVSPEYKDLYSAPLPIPPIKPPKGVFLNEATGENINYYEIEIKPLEIQLYPGLNKTRLVGYDGLPQGPTFVMEKGTEAVIRFVNHGDRASSVHLHGSYTRAPFDGWAEDSIQPGQFKDYYYPNKQNSRTLWYHDHAIDHTSENVYYGQAGVYIIQDPNDLEMGFPQGKYDVPLAISSKYYEHDGSLWSPESHKKRNSVYGDVIHVNGQIWPYFDVEPRKYRFRLLNMAVSRSFRLYLEDEANNSAQVPFTVIAADSGLLERSVQTKDLYLAGAERWEIIIDFADFVGKNLTLRNFEEVGADRDYPASDKVMRFCIGEHVSSEADNEMPQNILRIVPYPPDTATVHRKYLFGRKDGRWSINGVTWKDKDSRILAKPQRGAIEIWELHNPSLGWSHPIHIHLIDFQVVSRVEGKRSVQPYEKVAMKDVVWLGPGEKVHVIARFAPWDGVYMFHCHNLQHEDHTMMAAINISSLPDFNYTETTRFIDPMEERYRAVNFSTSDFMSADTWGAGPFSFDAVKSKVDWFASLDAYRDIKDVGENLEQYWADRAPQKTQSSDSTS